MEIFYTGKRSEWRDFLKKNHNTLSEIWFVFPLKNSKDEALSYNDAVEEALCFGWIDSTVHPVDENHIARRFTPRKKGRTYSRPNIERLIWLDREGLLLPETREQVLPIISAPFVYPDDIIAALKSDDEVWKNYEKFSEPYKRIRVAYIDAARKRPDEFCKRLASFIEKTRQGKMIMGFGGIDKYYG